MSVSANALTLAQYAQMSNDPLVQAITYSLIQNAIVMQDIPIVDKASMIVNGVRWTGNLPTVNWAKINTDPTVVSGTPSPYQEQVYLVRNAIDVDKVLMVDQNQISDPRAAQLGAYLKALAYDFNYKFINNSHTASGGDTECFVGIRTRLDNPSTYGVKLNSAGTAAEAKIDCGGATNTMESGANRTAATVNGFLEKLDQLLWAVDAPDGAGVVLYMNDDMFRKFAAGLRQMGSSALDITKDSFNRQFVTYKNAVLRDIGYKADQSTRIIASTETAAGADGSSTFTSIYAVHADEEHFHGWQMYPLVGQDVGLIGNGGTIYRIVVDWPVGLVQRHTRAIGRLYDIKVS